MNKNHLLRLLRVSRTGYISGAELATELGVSRTAVWKRIRALEREGYGIEAVPSKGYRLIASPDLISIDDLQQELATRVIGRDIRYVTSVPSTNTTAMAMAQNGAAEGTAVVAETQTGGKGRLGRTWVSPPGNLYLSIILRPPLPTHKAPLITLMGAVAVALAVRKATGIEAGIKWPNDILVKDRKVGGLLTEMSAEPDRLKHVVLGLGLNVNQDHDALPDGIRGTATSLAETRGNAMDRTLVLRALLEELDTWYESFLRDEILVLNAWRRLNVTLGREVAVNGQGSMLRGLAKDIDKEGRLVVVQADGTAHAVAAGDVTLLKRSDMP
jgi:BirA family biotin operon repressor/biotin-[acetyl-CoA-carboxylase] ligase